MISKVMAKNLKGLSFEHELKQFNLIIGPNGAGKSAIVHAIELAVLGYIPSDGDKQPGAIFASHAGSGEPFSVGIQIKEQSFGRTFKADGQVVFLNQKKIAARDISRAILEIGNPRIFDMQAFNDLSDAKKINYLFDLFPPKGNIVGLEEDINKSEERIKRLNEDIRGHKRTIDTLIKERATIAIPAGTLAETRAEIEQKEKDLAEARALLQEIETQEREAEATRKAEAKAKADAEKAEEKAKAAARKEVEEAVRKAEQAQKQAADPVKPAKNFSEPQEAEPICTTTENHKTLNIDPLPTYSLNNEFITDLRAILQTMVLAGCPACAATIQIKTLIAKYRGATCQTKNAA